MKERKLRVTSVARRKETDDSSLIRLGEFESRLHMSRGRYPPTRATGRFFDRALLALSDQTPETSDRVTPANLLRHIPRPLSRSPFVRPPFVRFNSGVRLFDLASLGIPADAPDFSRGVYPPTTFVCTSYSPSPAGKLPLRFTSPRPRLLFVGYNIWENTRSR